MMQPQPGWRGRCFEDFEPGDRYQRPLGRTVSKNLEIDEVSAAALAPSAPQPVGCRYS